MCGSSVLMLVFVRIRLTVLSTSPSFSFVLGDVTEEENGILYSNPGFNIELAM